MLRPAYLLHACVCWAATASSATPPVTALLLSEALSFDEQALYLALQGLANGNDTFTQPAASRVWLYEPVFWSNPASTYIFPSYLAAAKGMTFVNATSFCDAFVRLGARPQGLVLYNATHLDASRWLALTSAGLQSSLPVTASIMANTTAYSCISALPVVTDYTTYNFSSNVDAVAWGLQHLAPVCNASRAYSGGHSFCDDVECVDIGGDPAIDIGLDLAVAQRMFVFNLSPNGDKYPAHEAQFSAVATALVVSANGAVPSIFGWGEPEDDFTGVASAAGAAVVCDAAPNLSLWARINVAGPVTLPFPTSNATLNTSAYYLTFQTNEGDTPKILAALMQGAWLDVRRGSIPIAWGINPLMLEIAPALLEYYTTTARSNDSWFAGTAGAGYAYPLMMPNNATYAARVGNLLSALMPATSWPPSSMNVDIWDSNDLPAYNQYVAWAGAATVGMITLQPEELQGVNTRLADGTPVVVTTHFGNASDLWYPTLSATDPWGDLGSRIQALMDAHPPPFFMLCYGNLLDGNGFNIIDYALQMQQRFPQLQIVGMQDAVKLAREAVGTMAL